MRNKLKPQMSFPPSTARLTYADLDTLTRDQLAEHHRNLGRFPVSVQLSPGPPALSELSDGTSLFDMPAATAENEANSSSNFDNDELFAKILEDVQSGEQGDTDLVNILYDPDIELDLPDTSNQRSRSSSASGKERGESSDDQDNFQGGYAAAPPTSGESDGSLDTKIEEFKEYFRNGHLSYIAFPRRGRRGKNHVDLKLYAAESTDVEKEIASKSGIWAEQPGGEEWLNELASIANNASCEPEPFFLPSIGWTSKQWDKFLYKECKDLAQKINAVKTPEAILRISLSEHNVNLKRHIVFMMILAKLGKIEFYNIPAPLPPDTDEFGLDTASTFQFIDMAAALPN